MKKRLFDFLRFIIYLLSLILTFVYIFYRIIFTIPFNYGIVNLTLGIIVLTFEFFDAVDFCLYYFNVLRVKNISVSVPKIKRKTYPDVDVLIATINEDIDLVSGTVIACLNMKYPSKSKVHIYLCDDGNRSEMRDLALKYNIGYISRNNNLNAKAGNYNNALRKTRSPFIATFDADMKPSPYFLLKTIPFFVKYDDIGFVQTPQSFDNPDIFQLRYGVYNSIPFEQNYFYHKIQSAKCCNNSLIYCGTNAVLSRKALNDIGGFAVNTITEDFATGMLIESKNYRSIYLDIVLASGLNVYDLSSFLRQRSRWSRGCIQVLKNYKIFCNKGLNFRQKIDYISAIFYWFYGFKRFFYLIIPLLFSLFGIMIIDCDLKLFCVLFFSQYLLKRIAIDLFEGRSRSSTWNKIYELILAPSVCVSILRELFIKEERKFDVTPKVKPVKKSGFDYSLFLYHLFLFLLCLLGIILSIYKSTVLGFNVYLISLIWLIINLIYLFIVLVFDINFKKIEYSDFVCSNKYKLKSIFMIFLNFFKR